MPHEQMFVFAQLILDVATADINQADEIRTALKDIWDIRQAKLRFVVLTGDVFFWISLLSAGQPTPT